MEINVANELFDLSKSYQNWTLQRTQQKMISSTKLLDGFTSLRLKELSKLPYRLNLLDDLSTNENAHSKFLIRLLQYKPALLNFLEYLNNNSGVFNFNLDLIKRPELTWEKMRIDGLIKENNKYAIIIENKIHNAKEQEYQVGRYIEKCRAIGYKVEQIYVLYLTRTNNDHQSSQSWGVQYTIGDFKTRYSKLSYRSDILYWLEEYLETLDDKESLIKSAVIQYIDHLKHLFNKKEIYKNMNKELKQFLSDELKLTTDKAENVEIVNQRITELNELSTQLMDLMKTSKSSLFEEWKDQINEKYDFKSSQIFCYDDTRFVKTGVELEFQGHRFSVLIEHNGSSIYYGFGRHSSSDTLLPEVKYFLGSLIEEESFRSDNSWWYGWKYTSFKNALIDFEYLLKRVLEQIEKSK